MDRLDKDIRLLADVLKSTTITLAALLLSMNLTVQGTIKPPAPIEHKISYAEPLEEPVLSKIDEVEEIPNPTPKTPQSAPETPTSTCEAEILKYDWDTRIARAVMLAESGGNPNAVNDNPRTRDYSVGCFQINLYGDLRKSRPSEAELKNPEINVRYAYNLWKSTGWARSWGAYSNGSYKKYL